MANDFSNIEIFEGKTYDKLLKQIHDNSEEKSVQLKKIVQSITKILSESNAGPSEAVLLMPLITECMDVSIRNDDMLIKLAGIIQRIIKANNSSESDSGGGGGLTAEERAEIIANARASAGKVIKMGGSK
jgi:hypothetical protein